MRIPCWPSAVALLLSVALQAQQMETPGRAPDAWLDSRSHAAAAVPETDEIRRKLLDELYAPAPAFGALRERLYGQADGRRVQFRIESQGGYLYYLFLAQSAAGFPIAGRGNYVVKKRPDDGRFLQIKIFFRDDPECFVRLFPSGERSLMDVHLFGTQVYRSLPLALSLEDWLSEPFSRLQRLSGSIVDWDLLLAGQPGKPRALEGLRRALESLPDGEDGAMDERGRLVLIETGQPAPPGGGLNCSGFAKWVVDGFRQVRTGDLLAIEPLKAKHLQLRGNRWSLRHEEERDPYFGLDWSRNLAVSAWRSEGLTADSPEQFDVRRGEFVRYREDVGYAPAELRLVLFLEALDHPDRYYLGSVNRDYGQNPSLRQHYHIVVLFPYFGERGEFEVAVFDRNRESSIAELERRFAGSYVHLVGLPGGSFAPPVFTETAR